MTGKKQREGTSRIFEDGLGRREFIVGGVAGIAAAGVGVESGVAVFSEAGVFLEAGVGLDCGLIATSAAGVGLALAASTESGVCAFDPAAVLAEDVVLDANARRATLGANSLSAISEFFAAAISEASNVGTSRRPDRRLLESGESTELPLREIRFEAILAGVERRLEAIGANAGGFGIDGLASVGALVCCVSRDGLAIRDSPGRGSRMGVSFCADGFDRAWW